MRRFAGIETVARRKLRPLEIAGRLDDLRMLHERPAPITPGDLLKEDFLVPLGISQYRLAKEIGVPAKRIGEIIAGRRSITADTDLQLCRFFGLSSGYWRRA